MGDRPTDQPTPTATVHSEGATPCSGRRSTRGRRVSIRRPPLRRRRPRCPGCGGHATITPHCTTRWESTSSPGQHIARKWRSACYWEAAEGVCQRKTSRDTIANAARNRARMWCRLRHRNGRGFQDAHVPPGLWKLRLAAHGDGSPLGTPVALPPGARPVFLATAAALFRGGFTESAGRKLRTTSCPFRRNRYGLR